MKRFLVICILSMLLACTACQSAGKIEDEVQLFPSPSSAHVAAEKLSHMTENAANNDEALSSVVEKRVTQEMVDCAIELLMPNAAFYEPAYQKSKQELLEELEIATRTCEENVHDGLITQKEADTFIALLEEEIEKAPEDLPKLPAQARFGEAIATSQPTETSQPPNVSPTPAPLPQEMQMRSPGLINVEAIFADGKAASFSANRGDGGSGAYLRYYADLTPQYSYAGMDYRSNVGNLPGVQVAYADARTQAETLMQDMGLNYLSACHPLSDRIVNPRNESYKGSCYVFLFTKSPLSEAVVTAGHNEWPEEYVLIRIGNEGIFEFGRRSVWRDHDTSA